MYDAVTVGHILVDTRVLVDDFATTDREVPIKELSYGLGGSAANVAVGITYLGGRAAVVGKIGIDSFGRLAIDELMRKGVDTSYVRVDLTGATGFSIIIVNREGKIVMYGSKGSAEMLTPNEVLDEALEKGKIVYIASLRADTAARAAAKGRGMGKLVMFDPGRVQVLQGIEGLRDVLRGLDVLLVNSEECRMMSGEEDFRGGSSKIQREGVAKVVVKLGSKGVYVREEDTEYLVQAYKVKAVDTTGAGDSFSAGVIRALSEGKSFEEAVTFGNAVAAIKTTRLGAQAIPTREEVEAFIKERGEPQVEHL